MKSACAAVAAFFFCSAAFAQVNQTISTDATEPDETFFLNLASDLSRMEP